MTQLSKTIEEKLKTLRERYSPQPVPKCHICGAEMTVQRMSASRITYGCTGATYDDVGCHYATGRSIADDHYEQSRVTVVDVSDPDVLELIDSLKAEPQPVVVPDDTRRLDWLDAQNKRLNEYYGTSYGWKFDANFQRNAMMLNDSNYPVMNVRQAIDKAMRAASQEPTK